MRLYLTLFFLDITKSISSSRLFTVSIIPTVNEDHERLHILSIFLKGSFAFNWVTLEGRYKYKVVCIQRVREFF